MVARGAAEAAGFTAAEVALACASHGGEPPHVAGAATMLAKAGFDAGDLECGTHWPSWSGAARDLVRAGDEPTALHNNCSGKHSGMLALAKHLGAPTRGYVKRDHPVQRAVADTMTRLCDCDLDSADWGIDGCSVPTWAVPLRNLALGFARFGGGAFLAGAEADAARRILAAVAAHPYMVAGSERFCTELMRRVPRAFVKTGAEGVFCGCVPHLGLGIALKCDDGAGRASECVMAHLLERLDGFEAAECEVFAGFARRPVLNRRDFAVGEVRPVEGPFGVRDEASL
jgi:L-asparaginase II